MLNFKEVTYITPLNTHILVCRCKIYYRYKNKAWGPFNVLSIITTVIQMSLHVVPDLTVIEM